MIVDELTILQWRARKDSLVQLCVPFWRSVQRLQPRITSKRNGDLCVGLSYPLRRYRPPWNPVEPVDALGHEERVPVDV